MLSMGLRAQDTAPLTGAFREGYLILVVDDDPVARFSLRRFLEREKYLVAEAVDGAQAVGICRQVQPDLVLMASAMPGLDGFTATTELRRLPEGDLTPVVMVMPMDDDESINRAYKAGASDYVTKPIQWSVLRQRVRHLLRGQRAEKEVKFLARFPLEHPYPMMRLSHDGSILYANAASQPVLDHWHTSLSQRVPAEWRSLIINIARSEASREVELTVGDQTFSFIITPVSGASYVNLYGRDVTDRAQAEAALRANEQQYRALFERTNDAIFFISLEGQIILINQQAADLLGYAPDELIGQPIEMIISPNDHARARQRLHALREGQTFPVFEQTLTRKGGDELLVENNAALVFDADSRPLHIQSIVRDISERRQLEQLRTEFVSTVSHELRTPLASILGFTETLLTGGPGALTETQREFLGIIQESGQQLLRLVNDLLDAARIESGRLPLRIGAVNVPELLQQAAQALRPVAQARRVDLQVEILDNQSPVIEADRQRLEQIINNLLSNALKFTPANGYVTLRLKHTPTRFLMNGYRFATPGLQIDVQDTGIGIPVEDLPHIFERFHRAANVMGRSVEGTGLGLHITQGLVQAHRGQIWAQSEAGQGTTFHVWLPVAQTSLEPEKE